LKCIKEKRGFVQMVVGVDIPVSEVVKLTGKTLVGRFNGKQAGEVALSRWMDQFWKPVLGYIPEAHALARGWNSFLLWSEDDYNKLLQKNWNWGPSDLVLKPWMVEFDPVREPMEIMRVWAILLGPSS
jgi:hypothetical protein